MKNFFTKGDRVSIMIDATNLKSVFSVVKTDIVLNVGCSKPVDTLIGIDLWLKNSDITQTTLRIIR